jgi:hypothetical protein
MKKLLLEHIDIKQEGDLHPFNSQSGEGKNFNLAWLDGITRHNVQQTNFNHVQTLFFDHLLLSA